MGHERLIVFWIAHLALLSLFGLEILILAWIWLGARVPGLPRDASRLRKLAVIIGRMLKGIFSRGIITFIVALVLDGMVHRRLFRTDKLRWFAHSTVFWSFLILGVLSTITGVAVEFFNPIPANRLSPIGIPLQNPIIDMLVDMDNPVTAILNEGFGLIMLIGLFFVLWRRYGKRDTQLRTKGPDTTLLVLLAIVVLGGYVVEAFRFLAEGVPANEAIFGPIGYLLSLILGLLPLSREVWEVVHFVFFFAHFLTVSLLLFAMPFSKFFHTVMSPLVVALNAVEEKGGAA
jgi:hypothetical protein